MSMLHGIKDKGSYRPVGSGAAWRRSPHQKSAGREGEKKEKGRKKEKRGERKERGGKGREMATSKRERCRPITPI